jgi:hypothetical protein
MADLRTDGAQVFSRWHNDGMTGYRKRPRDPAQLTKLMTEAALLHSTPRGATGRMAAAANGS